MSTWHDKLPTSFNFMAPTYCETCGDYGVSLDIDLADDFPSVNGEWGCTGGFSWYPEKSYSGAELYRELAEAGYDENMHFDETCADERPAWLAFLAEIKNDNTAHPIEEFTE